VTLADGQITVRVALELGPNDTPTSPDWTDLTDRVLGYRDQRGRTDVLREFQPGTADVVLDNGDRMLDPSNPDGLLYSGATRIGLPLCPVQIGVMWGGVEYPKFYGYLGPEAWPGDTAPHGPSGTVTLSVVDALGHSPGLPGDMWGVLTAAMQPDWWLRMDEQEFPVLDDLSEIPNSLGAGHATVYGTTGISRPYTQAFRPAGYGVIEPGLLLSGDHEFRSPAASIMPDGDEDKVTVMLWWAARTEIDAGDVSVVARMEYPGGGNPRWDIIVDGDDGLAYVTAYDSGGTPVDTGTITPVTSARWDIEDSSHLVIAVWDAADASFTVWFGGVSTALTIGTDLYESDLVHGPNTVDVMYDEVTVWRRALPYAELVPVLLFSGFGGYWCSDTWADRLGHWVEATGRTVTFDDTDQWHVPGDGVLGLWGIIHPQARFGDIEGGIDVALIQPDNLADAYQATVESGGGARWATKDGYLRARTIHALTDVTYADHYATPVTFTDEDATLGTDEYRHAGVETTGLRIDRVINTATVSYQYAEGVDTSTGPDVETSSPMVNRQLDRDSRDRYGIKEHSIESAWADWPLNQQMVDLIVTRFAQPRQEIEVLHLDPLGDADLGEWLTTTCELELACTVIYTPFGSDPITVEGLNIQQIAWDWTPERWSVDLMVAAS